MTTPARILIAAGSDSGGGAGVQADIKTVTSLGGYALTAITALTAQNTTGVHGIHPVPLDFIALQIECVWSDVGADAVKTGMLGDAATIAVVADAIERRPRVPFVLDPVMVAKGGARLLADEAVDALRSRLLPLATVLTPNIPEAEAMSGLAIGDVEEMREACRILLQLGVPAVLLKGGHLAGSDQVTDILATRDGLVEMTGRRVDTRHTHGTGCTLASAIATGLAQGMALEAAVRRARAYVLAAIETAPGFGQGHGPLNHMVEQARWSQPR